MRLYLIRHGESTGNVTDVGQGKTDPLTDKGKDEVRRTAQFLKNEFNEAGIVPDLIITSTHLRTRESANIVREVLDNDFVSGEGISGKIEYKESETFVEFVRPTEQVGKSKSDPDFLKIDAIMHEEASKDWNYAYGDGESPKYVVDRAKQALLTIIEEGMKIETGPKNKEAIIVLVSHSFFMRTMLGCAVFGDDMNFGKLNYMIDGFDCSNASVSILQKSLSKNSHKDESGDFSKVGSDEDRWRVVSWNSIEHLLC